MSIAHCPALLIAAPASGSGKTMITAALARRHRQAGRRVRVFKCGPDFLDPMVLERASGSSVYQLDLFMAGADHCRALLYDAAQQADLILVEGVMGLFDGDPSAADMAVYFGLPVMAVIDAGAMAQSFGALALGLATYRDDVSVRAVLANRVGGARHAAMLAQSVKGDIAWLGAMPRDAQIAMPERHLGLVQADEIADLDRRIDRAAALLPETALWLPDAVAFAAPARAPVPTLLAHRRIAIARDDAFAFVYPANLDVLRALGAELVFFSPLADEWVDADALWLPGGYPELHLERLSAHAAFIKGLRDHHRAGKPILAECGGMLVCVDHLDNGKGASAAMAGLIPGREVMQPRLAALGLQAMALPAGELRGHTFHYSRLETTLAPSAHARNPNSGACEALYRQGSLCASYVHFHFASNPAAAASLFGYTPPPLV